MKTRLDMEEQMFKPEILEKVKEAGFVVFDDGDYNLNLIAVRNLENHPNQFDDKLYVCYKVHGLWREHIFQITTDPGKRYLENPNYRDGGGVAIAAHPQQARSAYKIDLHRGKYKALVQRGPGNVQYWRDKNFDNRADYGGEIYDNKIGLNIHRSSAKGSSLVGPHSAGCIVFSDAEEFGVFMRVCQLQVSKRNFKTFTLTILAE
ncbi:MAG: hypothetical protein CMC15_15050 [Flavobacteriaceae bacterium]|nr:hypothetical protein [Flavobacteriaceae bacterium]